MPACLTTSCISSEPCSPTPGSWVGCTQVSLVTPVCSFCIFFNFHNFQFFSYADSQTCLLWDVYLLPIERIIVRFKSRKCPFHEILNACNLEDWICPNVRLSLVLSRVHLPLIGRHSIVHRCLINCDGKSQQTVAQSNQCARFSHIFDALAVWPVCEGAIIPPRLWNLRQLCFKYIYLPNQPEILYLEIESWVLRVMMMSATVG